jgi:hypothetical protein
LQTYEYNGNPFTEPRSHPWVGATNSSNARYYDLTADPTLIRSSLEDFHPWSGYAGIEAFYGLLEWLNQAGCVLESNDCAFAGPEANKNAAIPKALECSGRVMLLFRALERNTRKGSIERLKNALHGALVHLDPDFHEGVIGTTILPVRYVTLSQRGNKQLGQQLMVSFWAWGDDEADTMLNLERLVHNLSKALRTVCEGRPA